MALSPYELVVHYQPIYSLRDGVVVSVEALVRGRAPDGRLVGALAMLGQAQALGNQHGLDLAVLRQACLDMTVLLAEHQHDGLHGLNVNLTPASLVHPALDIAVLDILEETRLPPHYLRLEVPETAAFVDLAEATGALQRITATGVALTLDDVGVEAVGLRYLKQLTINGIKIDRSFITRMLNGASDLAVVRLLVDICAGLEIRLTAEGVERCEQVEVAKALGVRAIQGFHVARPLPLEQLQVLLRRGIGQVCRDCFGEQDSRSADRSGTGGPTRDQRAAVPSE